MRNASPSICASNAERACGNGKDKTEVWKATATEDVAERCGEKVTKKGAQGEDKTLRGEASFVTLPRIISLPEVSRWRIARHAEQK
jgi:hypothetical protein